jgi:hypothetical protein
MIPYVYNAPRGSEGERNDCTVRTLCISTNRPYTEAYQLLFAAGRKPNRGFYFEKLLKIRTHYLGHTFTKIGFCKPRTLKKFLLEYSKGTYCVRIRGHVFAIIDGTVHDMMTPKTYCRITAAWKVEPLTK